MELLFNKAENGNTEIKEILGFLDGGFHYDNIKSDVLLNTPYVIDLVGQDIYDKIAAHYISINPVVDATEKAKLDLCLQYMQIYLACVSYLDFAPDNDLSHGNNGRNFTATENQKIPWEWQLNNSDASIKRRAHKALDLLMVLLDGSEWTEWTASDQYKRANSILIKNTLDFDKIFPIDNSGQLYYKLVPFMLDFEEDHVCAILTKEVYADLDNEDNARLLLLAKKAVAYLSLGKALKVFPVEMMPAGLRYEENTSQKGKARAEVMQFHNAEGQKYLVKLENAYQQKNTTFTAVDPMMGLDEESNHVSL